MNNHDGAKSSLNLPISYLFTSISKASTITTDPYKMIKLMHAYFAIVKLKIVIAVEACELKHSQSHTDNLENHPIVSRNIPSLHHIRL